MKNFQNILQILVQLHLLEKYTLDNVLVIYCQCLHNLNRLNKVIN